MKKKQKPQKLITLIKDNLPFVILVTAFFSYFLIFAIIRHQTFHSFGLDMAVFNQIFWNTIHGRFWEFSLEMERAVPHSYFANHVSLILFFLVPFYYVFPKPETLITFQSIALATGAIPIFWFANKTLKSKKKALFAALIYFLSPFVQNINFFDFHEVALFIPLFGFCLLFMFQKKWLPFWIFLILSLFVKEEIGFIGFGLGLYLLINKNYKQAIFVSIVSLVWLIVTIKVIIPHFAKGQYKYFSYRYNDFGFTSGEIIKNILLNPLKAALVFLKPKKLYFLAILFGSTGFISLLAFSFLIVIFMPLLYLLLSSYAAHYSYTSQYSAVLIPILFFALILGLKKLEKFKYQQAVYIAVFLVALLESVLFGVLPFSRKFDINNFKKDSHYAAFNEIKSKIPASSSLSTQNFVASHLYDRRYLEFYTPTTKADFIFLDIAAWGDRATFNKQLKMHTDEDYRIEICKDGLCLLARKQTLD